MNDTQPKGCLAAILRLVGINLSESNEARNDLPYRLRDDFLSAAEFSFYRVLINAVGNRAAVCPKVNLADIFFVPRANGSQGYRNKIDRKHVDFLLCDPVTMKPLCGIELDDSSHNRQDRQERDEFVDSVFEAAGVPLLRVRAQSAYSPAGLLALIEPHLDAAPATRSAPLRSPSSGVPMCPKCGVPMVERVASRGRNAGQTFFGCPNYPQCKETQAQ